MPQLTCRVFGMALATAALSCVPAYATNYQVISENTIDIPLALGNLVKTDTVIQEGPLAINRFTMHRLRRKLLPSKGVVLLLPPLGNNFDSYLMHPQGDTSRSFAGYLARAGFDVWGYSPRETNIQSGDCGGGLDCSPALNWSVGTIVNDVHYIRSRITSILPAEIPAIGGFSLGAISAMAVVARNPNAYAGLIAWDGSVASDDPVVRAHNEVFCDQFRSLVSGGVAVDDQSLPFVKLVANLAAVAPNDLFAIPVPGFPPGLTNRQAFVFILSTPNPFAPSARPGFIAAAGDFAAGQFFFSDQKRLAANIGEFNDTTANGVSRDLYCSLAGKETRYTANLDQFTKPVLIIKAGLGFGSIMDELPGKLGSTEVTVIQNNNFGHADHIGAPNHLIILEAPVVRWLRRLLQ